MVDRVGSVRGFIELIFSRPTDTSQVISYRGLSDRTYALTPSIFRKDINIQNEHILLRELIAAHPDEFASDQTTLEQLVRVQHYALPTRLLDVSFNPLVALYFAAQDDRKEQVTVRGGKRERGTVSMAGDVVMLTVLRNQVKYFDSDTVSCITNLARLRWDLKEKINTAAEPGEFNKDLPIRRLLHFIRQEKNQFEAEIVPRHLDEIFLVKPKQNNKRILAQNGAFFVLGLTRNIEEPNRLGIKAERIRIPAGAKQRIRDELDKLNINEKTLFPEIERAARYLTGSLHDALVSAIVSTP